MGKTSTTAKNKYNAKAYDRIALTVKKGQKEVISHYAKVIRGVSLQKFINDAIKKEMSVGYPDICPECGCLYLIGASEPPNCRCNYPQYDIVMNATKDSSG